MDAMTDTQAAVAIGAPADEHAMPDASTSAAAAAGGAAASSHADDHLIEVHSEDGEDSHAVATGDGTEAAAKKKRARPSGGVKREDTSKGAAAGSASRPSKKSKPNTGHASSTSAATTTDPSSTSSSAPSKRRRPSGHPSHSSHSHSHEPNESQPAAPAKHLSPALLGILGDFVWTPKFLQTVLGHLGQTRSAVPNWHVVSALFRQKLVEGSWNKQTRFVIKKIGGGAGKEAKKVLARSRRVVGDFTPPVCERLYTLLTSRDRGPAASAELQRAWEEHAQLEVQAREMPFFSGGRQAQLPVEKEAIKLEFVGGLPKGESNLIAQNELAAVATIDGAAAPIESTRPVPGGDALDYWPGFTLAPASTPLGVDKIFDGASVRRWMKGHQVHPQMMGGDAAAPSSVIPPSALPLFQSHLASLHHLHRRFLSDQHAVLQAKRWIRRGVPLDWEKGVWIPGSAAAVNDSLMKSVTWTSPGDDQNLLQSISNWLSRQPAPTPETFLQAPSAGSHSLLPWSLAHWMEVRAICRGHAFSCGFFRRRWLVLFALHEQNQDAREATGATTATVVASEGASAGTSASSLAAPSSSSASPSSVPSALSDLFHQVHTILVELHRRITLYRERYGEIPRSRADQADQARREREEEERFRREEEEKRAQIEAQQAAAVAAAAEEATRQSSASLEVTPTAGTAAALALSTDVEMMAPAAVPVEAPAATPASAAEQAGEPSQAMQIDASPPAV
jgi:hypothetical protein